MQSVRKTAVLMLQLSLVFSLPLAAQESTSSKVWVFFSDRGSSSAISLSSSNASSLGISDRALQRREKVLPPERLLDEHDLPVAPEYLEALRHAGVTIVSESRWLNAVSVRATAEQLRAIRQLPFVRASEPVAVFRRSAPERVATPPVVHRGTQTPLPIDYGSSFTQLNNIQVVDVHAVGIYGSGVIVGMIDDGYNNHRTHNAMKHIRVIAEYDFIQRDSSTTRNANDPPGQGDHGAATLSALAGFENTKLIGPAFDASFILAKTEMIDREIQMEEDLYVEALEWMERLGADIVSTSLGYIDWYTYKDLDGKTAVTTRGALVAARKGVLLVTAMGNESHFRTRNPDSTGTLIAPADADSIVAVGAVSSTGVIAGFSSTGPTFDGRTKPEVVAQGVSVVGANGQSTTNYFFFSGTSLSTPLAAGSAALVLSAHPWLTPMQLREALMNTALRFNDGTSRTAVYPNNFYGWGRVQALDALLYHGIAFSNSPVVRQNGTSLDVSTWIASRVALVQDSVLVHYRYSPTSAFQTKKMTLTASSAERSAAEFSVTIPVGPGGTVPTGYFSARDANGNSRLHPHNAPQSLILFNPDQILIGPPQVPPPTHYILHQNYPNPFNGMTTIVYEAPASEEVEVAIYNLLGQRVRTLYRGNCVAGINRITWDATDEEGSAPVASGLYYYRLRTPSTTLTGAMIYLR